MATQRNNTENFYREIINKLTENIKEDFIAEGISEDVIMELKKVVMIVI
jgi:TolB-like protein